MGVYTLDYNLEDFHKPELKHKRVHAFIKINIYLFNIKFVKKGVELIHTYAVTSKSHKACPGY